MSDLNTSVVAEEQNSAPADDAVGTYRIWPGDGGAPGTEDWEHKEITVPIPFYETENRATRNVVIPTLTRFVPAPGAANGASIIIAPGGALHFQMIDHEGYKLARLLAARGMTAFVLRYRLVPMPEDHEAMIESRNEFHKQIAKFRATGEETPVWRKMQEVRVYAQEDGRQAVRFVRAHASAFGIDPDRIGLAGFSAGGAVVMGVALEHDELSRPAFVADIYGPPHETVQPPDDAAPLFLVHSHDDNQIDSVFSADLYSTWKRAGFGAELHIFSDGAHGFGTDTSGHLPDTWLVLFDRWLTSLGFLAADQDRLSRLFKSNVLEANSEEHDRRTRERS